jgi:hypothetical protein
MICVDQKTAAASGRQEVPRWDEEVDLPSILAKVRKYTMVHQESLVELARQVRVVLTHDIPGAFVECGAWRGGCSFLMAELLRQSGKDHRRVWMFDSFEGIPAPQDIDGAAAQRWATDTNGPMYFDNLRVSVEAVEQAAAELGLAPYVRAVKGWFQDALVQTREQIGPIALLRIDADWYDSVRCCLDSLFDNVVDGGLVLFDDYHTYDGAAIAVHEFLGRRKLNCRLEAIGTAAAEPVGAVFRKGTPGWQALRHQYLFTQQLSRASKRTSGPVVLVEQESFRDAIALEGIATLPFLEHQGQYWGSPADDREAIEQLERMRTQLGAAVIAFASPYFWWFDFYRGFSTYLRTRYRCIAENEYLVAFDLTSNGEGSR